ncbi:hypothetical protein [Janthinobacterium sp. PSRC1-1]|jgi:hypothetical protein|uniref:hypothetical protein n=1 Tax=Janthinobacterium sp. PSRC1-1 TaxID=2804586 RepID=UPI003CF6F59F
MSQATTIHPVIFFEALPGVHVFIKEKNLYLGSITRRAERLLFTARPGVTGLRQGHGKNVVNCGTRIYPDTGSGKACAFQ